jgi:NADH:ubiquinone oxidoreductase subunit 4 (subunit M)
MEWILRLGVGTAIDWKGISFALHLLLAFLFFLLLRFCCMDVHYFGGHYEEAFLGCGIWLLASVLSLWDGKMKYLYYIFGSNSAIVRSLLVCKRFSS